MHATAFSYLRFSSPQQATGDSIRRQVEARESWLAAHPGVTLDTSLRMTDAGRSGFRRKNWDTYALAQFVAHIKSGRVTPGSYLLVENLDRLSREDAGEATELFLSIVNKGVVVVQLSPVVMEFAKPVQMQNLMFAIVELSRGHSESALKSERVGKAWARKQREAGERIVTRRLPGWVKYADGKLVLDARKAAVVRRIYRLAIDGMSGRAIARMLNAEKVPVLGRTAMKKRGVGEDGEPKDRTVTWSNVGVHYILTTRAAVGEYVPFKTHPDKAKRTGTAVPGYYPAVVDEATFYAAQQAVKLRGAVGRGRRGRHVNLFAGLLTDATDGGPLTYRHQQPYAVIAPGNAAAVRDSWATFPADRFESAILRKLSEVKVADVLGGDDEAGKRVRVLAGRKEELEAVIRAWESKMANIAIIDKVAANLEKFGEQLKAVNAELGEAQRQAANPLSESFGKLATLADLLAEDNSDEMRLRVRVTLRAAIESVHCLFVGTTATRLAAVRIQFRTGTHRDYLVELRYGRKVPRTAKRPPPKMTVRSLAAFAGDDHFDLRDCRDAAALEKVLAKVLAAK